jgi:hypothetical protein
MGMFIEVDVDISADIMSRYVWRGLCFGGSPSIQPTMELSIGSWSIGTWGAYTTNSLMPYSQEVDLYTNYTFYDKITVSVTDYFFPSDTNRYNYFSWNPDSTSHILEGGIQFSGFKELPINLFFGYNFLGDKNNSIYIEAGYSFSLFDIFLGAGNGIYTIEDDKEKDSFALVNVGVSATKDIKITDKFSLPIMASFILNPQSKGVFLVFGLTI